MVNAHGYDVMSLDDLIEDLTMLREQYPELGAKPVWIKNCPPLYWPINFTMRGAQGTEVLVERGGN